MLSSVGYKNALMRTFESPRAFAASAFALTPATGPMMPPLLIVPVIAIDWSMFSSLSIAAVSTAVAAPALGPPTTVESARIV